VELLATLSTSLGVCIFPPTSAALEDGTISIASSYSLPVAPTAEKIIENARKTHVEAIVSVPAFLGQWATEADEETLAFLRTMRVVGFAGGPLAYEKGHFLVSQGVKVRSVYAGTEVRLVFIFSMLMAYVSFESLI
jgi:acyl-coenzyme A synthetase/AMP-(fatty) acid ligase